MHEIHIFSLNFKKLFFVPAKQSSSSLKIIVDFNFLFLSLMFCQTIKKKNETIILVLYKLFENVNCWFRKFDFLHNLKKKKKFTYKLTWTRIPLIHNVAINKIMFMYFLSHKSCDLFNKPYDLFKQYILIVL